MQLLNVLFLCTSDLSRVRQRLTAENAALERVVNATDAGIEEGVLGQSVVDNMFVVTCASIEEEAIFLKVVVGSSSVRTLDRTFLLKCGKLGSCHMIFVALFVFTWLADLGNWSGIVRVLCQIIVLHQSRHRRTRLEYVHAVLRRLGVRAVVLISIADAGHSRHVLIADGSLAGRNLPEHILPHLAGRRKFFISNNSPIPLVFAHNSVAAS